MNKKLNTVLFTVVATLLNVVLIVGFLILGFFIVGPEKTGGDGTESLFYVYAIIIVSIVLGWLSYQGLLKLYLRKRNPEDLFERLFKHREKHAGNKPN